MNASNASAVAPQVSSAPRFEALIRGLPVSLLLFAALEAICGPVHLYAAKPWMFFQVLAHVVAFVVQSMLGSIGYCALLIGVEALLSRTTKARLDRALPRLALHALPAAWIAVQSYETLAVYEEFRRHPLLVLPYVASFVVFLALGAALGWPPKRLGLVRSRWLGAAVSGLGFVALQALNHSVLSSRYFTLHLSVFQLSLPLLFLSVSYLFLARLGRGREQPRLLSKLVLSSLALVCASLLAASTIFAASRSKALGYTLLGESQVVYRPFDEDTEGPGAGLADPNGVARFLDASRLPRLPSQFALEDYNVLLIVSEALRFDRTSLADEKLATTPHLLELVRSGAYWFTRASSPSSATLPSNASLMSMTYASATHLETWAKSWCGELKARELTVAEVLGGAGYSTFRVSHDFNRGFARNLLGLGQGFAEQIFVEEQPKQQDLTVDGRIAEQARRALAARKTERFFGWVFFASPHRPYYARYPDWPAGSEEERYLHELRYMDEQLGLVLETLRDTGLMDKTVIVFTADHGEELRDHGGTGHLTLYEECTHVPLVVRVPGTPGGEISGRTSTAYVMPWLLLHGQGELRASAKRRATLELGPMLEATGGAVITELVGHDKMQTGLIVGDSKLIYDFNTNTSRAFDLARDPAEKVDVLLTDPDAFPALRAASAGYRKVRAAIRKYEIDPKRMPERSK